MLEIPDRMRKTKLTRSRERIPMLNADEGKYYKAQAYLKTLRKEFQTTRPICTEEVRPFTYQKLVQVRGVSESKMVTENTTVRLRQFGIPVFEDRIEELVKEIALTKQAIKDMHCIPAGYESLGEGDLL